MIKYVIKNVAFAICGLCLVLGTSLKADAGGAPAAGFDQEDLITRSVNIDLVFTIIGGIEQNCLILGNFEGKYQAENYNFLFTRGTDEFLAEVLYNGDLVDQNLVVTLNDGTDVRFVVKKVNTMTIQALTVNENDLDAYEFCSSQTPADLLKFNVNCSVYQVSE